MFGSEKNGRLKPVSFRPYLPSDSEAWTGLYRSNEGCFIPAGRFDKYKASLEEGTSLHLVGELDGRIVVAGALLTGPEPRTATLGFGLVDADHHRQGLGTTLLLARLALLPVPTDGMWVQLYAIASSYTFYERFGFSLVGVFEDETATRLGLMQLALWPKQAQRIKDSLFTAGVRLPTDYQIPEVKFLPLTEAEEAQLQMNEQREG